MTQDSKQIPSEPLIKGSLNKGPSDKGPILVVSGSRHITDYGLLLDSIKETGFKPSLIVHGNASGADHLASLYCRDSGIPEKKFEALWSKHGKAAGPMRNSEMIDWVQAQKGHKLLIALWDGVSKGTFDCITKAHKASIRVHVKYAGPQEF